MVLVQVDMNHYKKFMKISEKFLIKNSGEPITITTIVDIMNLIGKCVVVGNVRRTVEIVFGDPHSEEYLDLKNYKVNPHRDQYGWTSNNSIFERTWYGLYRSFKKNCR